MEDNQIPTAILDKLTKVCTCRSITRKAIKEAILDGCDTFPKIRERTSAGTGACGGKGCGPTSGETFKGTPRRTMVSTTNIRTIR